MFNSTIFDPTMFFSMFFAFVAASVTMEFFSFCLGLYLAKKNMKRQQEFEAEWAEKVAKGEVPEGMNPMQMMMGGGMPMPTVSGEGPTSTVTGQYL
ncbi:hypothetical protein LCGC14_1919240 [marine sediment metagenome]|uniref:Uncharacterized protein n=1 Tax=marine sediment metagenome TaxID=412755 RepID=A0A0F9FR36_9ZZZZ